MVTLVRTLALEDLEFIDAVRKFFWLSIAGGRIPTWFFEPAVAPPSFPLSLSLFRELSLSPLVEPAALLITSE